MVAITKTVMAKKVQTLIAVRKRVGDVENSDISPTAAPYQAVEVTAADHATTEGTIGQTCRIFMSRRLCFTRLLYILNCDLVKFHASIIGKNLIRIHARVLNCIHQEFINCRRNRGIDV